MADEPRENGGIPARRMTVEEYQRLEEIGVLGERVELIEDQILFGRYPFMFSGEAVAAAREAGIELADPSVSEAGIAPGARQPAGTTDFAEELVELGVRLGRVMRPEYVASWLRSDGVAALGGQRPIDLLARGQIDAVARVVSELEDPGAS